MTLDAVAAGKDVYVEKPVSHTIEEGAEMVKAIEASKQIVQTGTQQRSWEHYIQGKEIIQSGKLGQITFVQSYWYQHARQGQWPARCPTSSIGRGGSARPRTSRSAGALLPVASLLGLRRRSAHRPDDALDRRRPLVHERRGADLGLQLRQELQHEDVGGARHGDDDDSSSPTTSPAPTSAPTSAGSTTAGSSSAASSAR